MNMKGDFSRSTFDPGKHYTSVRMQQGRVQLDADWNEQADILLHLIVTQLQDLLGPGGTAATEPGFAISLVEPAEEPADQGQAGQPEEPTQPARTWPDFWIGAGRYYVDGLLCENEAPVWFSRQPDYPAGPSELHKGADADHGLAYLDVWGRHITAAEDPAIREIALGSPDTTTRVKTVWQVKLLPLPGYVADWRERGGLRSQPDWGAFVNKAAAKGQLQAKWERDNGAFLENHLYRVEIHAVDGDQVTFKWSRENGSVVFPIVERRLTPEMEEHLSTSGMIELNLEGLERDPYQLSENDWVEIVDDVTVLKGASLPLCQVKELDRPQGKATLQADEESIKRILAEIGERELQHPLLRRWEGDTRAIASEWLDLEHGIQVCFSEKGTYHAGDYWLIPARTQLDEGIEWPQQDGQASARVPHGITHHYAPLALLELQAGKWAVIGDTATAFHSLPHITANLIATDGRLEEVEETVKIMVQQTHVFESFKSEAPLERGDVVCIDRAGVEGMGPTEPGTPLPVRLASSEDGRLVVGVVGEPLDHDGQLCRVVLYGRVSCKVIGRVGPGDLLVPSPVPGRAQRAGLYLQPGTILGKALSLTEFEPAVVEKIEEGTQLDEIDMLKQLGSVDMLATLA
jgi:hypothetical protein